MLPSTVSAFAKADLWSADRPLASAASTAMAAACSTKTWQASVTRVTTLAPKASTSRASRGGWAATFATFDGLGEGLGEGVGPLPLWGGGGIRLNNHHLSPPLRLLSRPSPVGCILPNQFGSGLQHRWGGVIPPNLVDAPPPPLCSFCHTSLPVYPPSHKKHTLNKK